MFDRGLGHRMLGVTSAVCMAGALVAAQAAAPLPLTEVRPLAAELRRVVPADLPALTGPGADRAWTDWLARRDRAIRVRLLEGEDDTIMNWVLLGSSFTTHPPIRLDTTTRPDEATLARTLDLIRARIVDAAAALTRPGSDERRLYARRFLETRGVSVTADGRAAVEGYLTKGVQRVLAGWNRIAPQEATVPRAAGDAALPTSQFRDRGLSLDTALSPNFAVAESLAALKARGVLREGTVRRVAIVGAGLDFADKNTGFDFYPVQTVQPLAVLDALWQLGLAPEDGVQVIGLDISTRVVDHINRVRAQNAYTVRLPIAANRPWAASYRAYWSGFGARVGTPEPSAVPPALRGQVEMRAVRVGAHALRTLSAEDVNVITHRLEGAAFDLVIATNVLLYYGAFDQALALANIGAMLRDGGLLLTNTALPELRAAPLARVGSLRTLYTDDGAGDEMLWYRRGVRAPRMP